MKNLAFLLLVPGLLVAAGCSQTSTTTADTQTPPAATESQHAHDAGEIDHSVEGHGHGGGPHDGIIVDWGGGTYHVEFTVDHDRQQATVYVLGSDEKTPSPIDAETIELSISAPEMLVTLDASPQQGDPEGKASRFIGTHEKLGVVQAYAGTMTGVVDGTPYSGDFKEEADGSPEAQ